MFLKFSDSKSNAVNCPIPGHYSTHGLFPDNALTNHLRISDCFSDSHKLHIGCNNRETMEFGSDCSNVDPTGTEFIFFNT